MREKAKQKLNEISKYWNEIEAEIKRAEQIRGEVVIPAINEMRYAGRQIVDAWIIYSKQTLTEFDHEKIDEKFTVVNQYLDNANHDITDAVCTYCHPRIDRIVKQYGHSELHKVEPNILNIIEEIKEVNEIIIKSRHSREKRNEIYKEISDDYIDKLVKYYNKLTLLEHKILANRKRYKFFALIRDLFAIIGVLIVIFQLFM